MNQGIKNKQKKHIEEETTDMVQLNEGPSEPQQHLKMPRKCSDPGKIAFYLYRLKLEI